MCRSCPLLLAGWAPPSSFTPSSPLSLTYLRQALSSKSTLSLCVQIKILSLPACLSRLSRPWLASRRRTNKRMSINSKTSCSQDRTIIHWLTTTAARLALLFHSPPWPIRWLCGCCWSWLGTWLLVYLSPWLLVAPMGHDYNYSYLVIRGAEENKCAAGNATEPVHLFLIHFTFPAITHLCRAYLRHRWVGRSVAA